MFGSLTVYDGMTQVLSRIFRVPVNNKPITILELTGIPTEIVNVVVSVLCRMTFDFALWSEGQVPVTLVCEEAHRYVPANHRARLRAVQTRHRQDRQRRPKYGASLCIVTQRPAEIDPTILSQCNTVFALRMSNDRDQAIVSRRSPTPGPGLLEFLPSLGQREAHRFRRRLSLPVRIKFDELPRNCLPRSSTARFSEKWQQSLGDEGFLEQVVERWRGRHTSRRRHDAQAAMMADALGILLTKGRVDTHARSQTHAPAECGSRLSNGPAMQQPPPAPSGNAARDAPAHTAARPAGLPPLSRARDAVG